ncbi:MAG: hypothetical protein AAF362_06100 [Pseudomonadota bacterium]
MMKNLKSKQGEILLKPSIKKWGTMWFAMTALFLYMLISEADSGWDWFDWLVGLSSSFGILISTFQLIPGSSSLRIGDNGFTITKFFKKRFVGWGDCTEFKVWSRYSRGFKMADFVVFSTGRNGLWDQYSKRLSGKDDCLPDTYGMKAEVLCQLMNERRQKFIDEN